MKRTALYDRHLELGGRMVDFAGWELPVQYPTGPTQEHEAVRTSAGLFDIDHMGQFEVTGPDALSFLQHVQVADLSAVDVWQAQYSMLTYADGTIVDDIFIYRVPEYWLVVVNAANRTKDMQWMESHASTANVDLRDVSDETYMLALQGPASEQILQKVTSTDLASMAPRTALRADISGVSTLVGRTGYTGEDGFELYFPARSATKMWDALLDAGSEKGLLPCGLGARDSLRFEACMALYGHEIDATTTPIEARLSWATDLHHEFIGRDAILKERLEGPHRLLVGIEMLDRAVPREGYTVAKDGKAIGHVTSGMKSPTLDSFLAMAYVESEHSAIGTTLDVIVRDKPRKARVVKRPFYRRDSK